jgi:endonuclease/exonuclease/phosphatase family metal-dependent hydrolase
MRTNFLMTQRLVQDKPIREPTLLALALTVAGLVVLLGLCGAGIGFLPMVGYGGWVFAVVAGLLIWLVLGGHRRPVPDAGPPTGRQRWFRRTLGLARLLFIGVLVCWLGLIAWLALGPGGPDPAPKANPALIRVITWNIHCGQDDGPLWNRFDWPVRKHALRQALDQAQPDLLCVQEARAGQVRFLEEALPSHQRVGVGRDDGHSGGEHCAIYFDRERFEELGGDTFWLEEPTDRPRLNPGLNIKRICTWVRLRDRTSGHTLRVYNAHLYLTEAPNVAAARLILAHVAAGDPADAVLVAADFNSGPGAPSRRLLRDTGLMESAEAAGVPAGTPTLQMYGIGYRRIDGVLVGPRWRVHNRLILNGKPNNTYPSDHFAILADLELTE